MTAWTRLCSLGNCPEYRYVGGRVEIRDSARPHEVAWFRVEAWEQFVDHLRGQRPQIASDVPGVPAHAGDPELAPTAPRSPRNDTRVSLGGDA